MITPYTPAPSPTVVTYQTLAIDGIDIAYREAGDPSSPKLVLFHGWPSSSHQFRELIPALADRFHVIAPDYPGFGNSSTPDPAKFAYTFDHIADIIDRFLHQKGFTHYGAFVQDYGGPVGFRVFTKHPEALQWLTIQNTNAYEVGFSDAWAVLRKALWLDRSPQHEEQAAALLSLDVVKTTYLTGASNPMLISPDAWLYDYHVTLQRPHGHQLQLDLFYDYRHNVERYPEWQAFLRERQPKTIIFWGQQDLFFTPAGGEAYRRDLPTAEYHPLQAGHFATEDCLSYIAKHMRRFYDEKVTALSAAQ